MKTMNYAGYDLPLDAADRATLHEDADGAQWRVPTADGGYIETTDQGLAEIKAEAVVAQFELAD